MIKTRPSIGSRLKAAYHCLKGKSVLFNVTVTETIKTTSPHNISAIDVTWDITNMEKDEAFYHLIVWADRRPLRDGNVVQFKRPRK